MHKLRPPPPKKKVTLCRIINNDIHAMLKICKYLSSEFTVNKGVRQGDAIAPLLSNKCWKLLLKDLSRNKGNHI